MAFCTKCGAQINDEGAFCPSCGKQVAKEGKQGQPNKAPTFTPPTPTFTPPPTPRHSGLVCYHHSDEPATGRCAKCGKYLCKDCCDSYGVTNGDYAGSVLCYDCTSQLVAENVDILTRNKGKIKGQFILSIVGMAIGFIMGLSMGISAGDFGTALLGGLIYAGIGGVFLSAVKAFFSLTWEAIKIAFSGNFGVLTILSLIFQSIVIVFKCIWLTISNTIYYIRYLRQTSGFIEEDTAALRQMRDYMEYTLTLSRNKGVDLNTLMDEDSALYNNSFAQAVREHGEAQATANLRNSFIQINEHGEIIRDFAAA